MRSGSIVSHSCGRSHFAEFGENDPSYEAVDAPVGLARPRPSGRQLDGIAHPALDHQRSAPGATGIVLHASHAARRSSRVFDRVLANDIPTASRVNAARTGTDLTAHWTSAPL